MGKGNDNGCDNLLLKEILRKLTSLEQEVEKLKSKPEYHINIEKLDVQQLDSLTFQLDTLDIKDLSGTLNIGNNFDSKKPPCKPLNKKNRKSKEDS